MQKNNSFSKYPPVVLKSFAFLTAGWIALLAFVYHINLSFPGTITVNNAVRVAIVGVAILFFVFKVKPWARRLCLFFNIGIIVINGLFVMLRISSLGLASSALTAHAFLNCLLFGLSTYYLMLGPTVEFYKQHLPKPPDAATPENRSAGNVK